MTVPTSSPPPPGILVADGEPPVGQLLKHALEMSGFRVWAASSGDEALALFLRHQEAIALALLDLDLDGMKNLGTLDALRQRRPDLPFCLLTTNPCPAPEIALADGRRYRVLEKPFRVAELIRTVRDLLEPGGPPATP